MRISGKKIADYIKPMLATATDKAFDSNEWLFELKLDGYRAIAEMNAKKILLYSRNGIDLSTIYSSITDALKKMKIHAVLDGEIVVLKKNGKPDFQALQNYNANTHLQMVYYVFDILSFQHHDLKEFPLLERKKLLKKILKRSATIRYCDHILNRGKEFYNKIKRDKLEGIMAKNKYSIYRPGVRTREWLKIKYSRSQEAVIIGYTTPKGSREHFGSLLLAQYRKNKLYFIGHTGTGFNAVTLGGLMSKMQKIIVDKSPVSPAPKANGAVTWIKPVLVCEVKFTEATKEGILRHPVYKGLRPDKNSKSVKEESQRELPAETLVHSIK